MLRPLVTAGIALALILGVTGIPTGAANAAANSPVTGQALSPDAVRDQFYQAGFAEQLCPQPTQASIAMLAATVCQIGRSHYAVAHGATMRAKAISRGAQCERFEAPTSAPKVVSGGLWVCFGYESFLVQRGGTTYGDTFFSTQLRQEFAAREDLNGLLVHEANHVLQWHLFGTNFPQQYLEAGPNACRNFFEVQAGLALGGYGCD